MYVYIHREILEIIYGKMLIVVIISSEVTCDFYFKIIKIWFGLLAKINIMLTLFMVCRIHILQYCFDNED